MATKTDTPRTDTPPATGDTPAPVDTAHVYTDTSSDSSDSGSSAAASSAGEKAGEMKDRAAEKAGEMKDRAGQKAGEVKDRAAEKAGEIKDRAADQADRARDEASRQADRAKGEVQRGADSLKGQYEQTKEEARRRAGEAYGQAREFTREAGDKARQQWDEARRQFDSARQDLTRQLQGQKEQIAGQARGVVTGQKDRLAAGAGDLAAAARAAADTLRDRDDATVANYAGTAADQLESLSGYLRNADLDDLIGELRGFARRQPTWFLGGAFVAGLAVSRFFKADVRTPYRGRGLPEGADETLYDDLVDSQHEARHRSELTAGRPPAGFEPAAVSPAESAETAAMPGVPAFGEDAPIAVGTPSDAVTTGDDVATPGASSRGDTVAGPSSI